jgi:hypothetical protein
MDFKTATDVLTSAPAMSLGRIAEALDRDTHTIVRARMEGTNARKPPPGWQPILAQVAVEYARALQTYADELERLASSLDESPKASTE